MPLLTGVKAVSKKTVPVIKTGYTVRVHQRIKEGEKERIQIFEGLVIKVNSGHGADKTFTVRKIVQGIGVEKVFPLYSTNISKIDVVKIAKVRRAKLYYMRDRSGKSARLQETQVSKGGVVMEEVAEPVKEEAATEENAAPVAEEAATTEEVKDEAAAVEEKAEEKAPEAEEAPKEEAKEEPKEEAKAEEAPAEEAEEKKEE